MVTGASRGLGRAIAITLAERGARVALVARDRQRLDAVASEISDAGGQASVFLADVSKEADVLALEAAVSAEFGRIQILVNNAGFNFRKDLTDFSYDEWRSVQDTNVGSVFLLSRAFIPHMRESGFGRMVNMASMMGHVSLPQRAAYSASKFAVRGLTKALALELASDNITVNSISPGPFATEMNTRNMADPALNNFFVSRIPVGRWGKVEEIGPLVAYLCAEEAGFITGTDILIDGGWCAL